MIQAYTFLYNRPRCHSTGMCHALHTRYNYTQAHVHTRARLSLPNKQLRSAPSSVHREDDELPC